jgi:hypothetical protein
LRVVSECDATIRHSYNLARPRTSTWSALTRREPATDPWTQVRTLFTRIRSERFTPWAWRAFSRRSRGLRRAAGGPQTARAAAGTCTGTRHNPPPRSQPLSRAFRGTCECTEGHMRSVHRVTWQAKWRVGRHFEAFEATSHLVLHPQGAQKAPHGWETQRQPPQRAELAEKSCSSSLSAASPQLPAEETCI